MLERAAILCEGGLITAEHLSCSPLSESENPAISPIVATTPPAPVAPETSDLRTLERSTIQKALEQARYNKSIAAKALGLSRKQLYVRLRQHGLE
jgi:DNA-binding NtrC family response regulator